MAANAGCQTPAEIVARVYPGVSPALSAAAAETVRAHLEKLAAEGRSTEREH